MLANSRATPEHPLSDVNLPPYSVGVSQLDHLVLFLIALSFELTPDGRPVQRFPDPADRPIPCRQVP